MKIIKAVLVLVNVSAIAGSIAMAVSFPPFFFLAVPACLALSAMALGI